MDEIKRLTIRKDIIKKRLEQDNDDFEALSKEGDEKRLLVCSKKALERYDRYR